MRKILEYKDWDDNTVKCHGFMLEFRWHTLFQDWKQNGKRHYIIQFKHGNRMDPLIIFK